MFRRICEIILGLLVAGIGFSGVWTGSGGGEISSDGKNPWFFTYGHQTKRMMGYCIEIDEQNFGVDGQTIRTNVRMAFDYWRDEFASADQPFAKSIYIAQELFYEVSCDVDPDLKLQFGFLTQEQEDRLINDLRVEPRQHVGLAIRTDYNPETLQGRGFVYLSPARGRLRMLGEGIHENPWARDGSALNEVLRHELGHVFGVPHFGDRHFLMGESFPYFVVSDQAEMWSLPPSHVFGFGANRVQFFSSVLSLEQRELLGLSNQAHRAGFRVLQSTIEIVEYSSASMLGTVVGVVPLTESSISTRKNVVSFWLPREQEVFAETDGYDLRFFPGPHAADKQASGSYQSYYGNPLKVLKTIFVRFGPSGSQLGGVDQAGRLILDIARE